ncbi:hypothetical protein [Paraburkholderia caballeronis]|uniref:hypothetical protein n=1 Tax=Paraburkholderia caballeronis TaxID=416943 RepID=UPI001064C71F|nr:hypothetical protein [Paraburkholderia caballeronis]TDV17131.1 hypothetical protein C7406_10653 [Paraburkholderia caballeronis]TDV17516.1 hypothetical protein C7408_104174 [Paraburkholderia caballeronis]TDV27534.1 hypothetical protein C7404_104174 [Paraburkholderia caballeronis]
MLLPLEPCRVQVLSLEYHLALSVPCSGRDGMEQVARLARALYLARYRDGAADAGMDAMIFDMARKRAGGTWDRQLSSVPRYRFVDAWAKVQRLADGSLPVGGTDDMRATTMLPAQR